ncbi:iron-containing alcohol dehydrogenase [Paenisporosarcina sp. TG20]|uniref:iron-containing alcohol dehydrogenase n=1 Tax=Paenisporosarcina sp. TG20 TaxID=1211706 RepID=UPI0002EACE0E
MKSFISPKNIYYGINSIDQLNIILEEEKSQHVFLVTDPGILELGIIQPLITIIQEKNIQMTIYSKIEPEPSTLLGNEILRAIRESDADLLIGVGGGSSLDLAKTAAVLVDNPGDIEDYLNLTGTNKITKKGLTKVMIPTTAGTGAEVTDIAVFSTGNTKDVITHKYMVADYVIVDPTLTYSLPSRITAASGVDAFTHAIEAYTSVNASPMTNSFALSAINRIQDSIRTAVWNGRDIKAREEMSLASLEAGLSFYNAGVAGVHALAYPLGGLFKIPHGESNAVLLPYVYSEIWASCIPQLVDVATAIGLPIVNKSDREIALSVVNALFDLVQDVGLPNSLQAFGIQESDLEILTDNALKQTRLLGRSPKPLGKNEIYRIYENAYNGKLPMV